MVNVQHCSNGGFRAGEALGELGGPSAGAHGMQMPHSNPRGRGLRGGMPHGGSGHAHRGAAGSVAGGCGPAVRKAAAGAGAWPYEQEVGTAAAGQGGTARANGHTEGAPAGGAEEGQGLDDDEDSSDGGGAMALNEDGQKLNENGQTDLDKRRDKRRRYDVACALRAYNRRVHARTHTCTYIRTQAYRYIHTLQTSADTSLCLCSVSYGRECRECRDCVAGKALQR